MCGVEWFWEVALKAADFQKLTKVREGGREGGREACEIEGDG